MGRKKTWKNPEVTDIQRDRVLKRRTLEEVSSAEEKYSWSKAKTLEQKFVDYLQGKTRNDHITTRLLKSVIFKFKYGAFYYPKTEQEKYQDSVGLGQIYQFTYLARHKKKYKYLSLGNEILHKNPDTGDLEYVLVDFNAERSKNSRKKSQVLLEWETNRSEITNTMIETIKETVERAQLSATEIERLKREEQERYPHLLASESIKSSPWSGFR